MLLLIFSYWSASSVSISFLAWATKRKKTIVPESSRANDTVRENWKASRHLIARLFFMALVGYFIAHAVDRVD